MNHIIIKVESGVVAEIYHTEPVQVTVVDHDVIEGGETLENRMRKAVLSKTPEYSVRPEEIDRLVTSMVLGCRGGDGHPSHSETGTIVDMAAHALGKGGQGRWNGRKS